MQWAFCCDEKMELLLALASLVGALGMANQLCKMELVPVKFEECPLDVGLIHWALHALWIIEALWYGFRQCMLGGAVIVMLGCAVIGKKLKTEMSCFRDSAAESSVSAVAPGIIMPSIRVAFAA